MKVYPRNAVSYNCIYRCSWYTLYGYLCVFLFHYQIARGAMCNHVTWMGHWDVTI